MRKKLCVLLCGCMLTGMLSGCMGLGAAKPKAETLGDSTAETGNGTAQNNDEGEIDYDASFELRLMTSLNGDTRSGLLDEAIEIFHQKWPNVTITNETTTDYPQKLKLAFSSGDGYEVVYVDDLNQQMLMEGNYLMDITQDVEKRGWLDKTVNGAVAFNNLRTPGQYYSTAFLMAPVVVYYNKDIFAELGVEIPTTVDELEVIMEKAKAAGYIPTECAGDQYHQILWAVEHLVLNTAPKEEVDAWYYGEASSDNVKKSFMKAYQYIEDWYQLGYFRENFEGVKVDDIPTLFSQGKTAFTINGDWDLPTFEMSGLNIGAFAFPPVEKSEAPYIVNATDGAWALSADLSALEKEAALDWIEIFYQDDYVKRWYENGFTIATMTDVSDIEASALQKEIAECTQDTQIGFYLDNVKSGYLDYMIKETQLLIQGEHTPESLWDNLEAEWNNK